MPFLSFLSSSHSILTQKATRRTSPNHVRSPTGLILSSSFLTNRFLQEECCTVFMAILQRQFLIMWENFTIVSTTHPVTYYNISIAYWQYIYLNSYPFSKSPCCWNPWPINAAYNTKHLLSRKECILQHETKWKTTLQPFHILNEMESTLREYKSPQKQSPIFWPLRYCSRIWFSV